MPLSFRRASTENSAAQDPLRDFRVRWTAKKTDEETFVVYLEKSTTERQLQRYLEQHPVMLIRPIGGLPLKWVIPQKRLGSEHVPDFVIGERDSTGYHWIAVELESPKAKLFNKNGDPSKQLNHAIRQLTDWRTWLKRNQNYAARLRSENGLGLTDIDSDLEGLIIIGRRLRLDPMTKERRREMANKLKARIHTYDWLIEMDAGSVRTK